MWNAPPRLQVWLPELTSEQTAKLGLPQSDSPLEARWINREGMGGQQAYADGLREKDVVIALAGLGFVVVDPSFDGYDGAAMVQALKELLEQPALIFMP